MKHKHNRWMDFCLTVTLATVANVVAIAEVYVADEQSVRRIEPPGQIAPGGRRRLIINGVPVSMTLSTYAGNPDEAVRAFATYYTAAAGVSSIGEHPVAQLETLLGELRDAAQKNTNKLALNGGKSLSYPPQQSPDNRLARWLAGMVQWMEMPRIDSHPLWSSFARLPTTAWSSGDPARLDSLFGSSDFQGPPVIVIAKDEGVENQTQLFTLLFEPQFHVGEIFRTSNGDVGGKDLELVERHSGSSRIFNLQESASFGSSHIVGYESPGGISQHFGHYARELSAQGFDIRRSHVDSDNGFLDAVGEQGSIAVFITPMVRNPSRIIDVIQLKKPVRKRL